MVENQFLDNLDQLETNSQIFIYGAGIFGRNFLEMVRAFRSDISVSGFIDRKKSGLVSGVPVLSLDDFNLEKPSYDHIIISTSPNLWNEITETFEKNRIQKCVINRHFDFDIFGEKKLNKNKLVQDNYETIKQLLKKKNDKDIWYTIYNSIMKNNIKKCLSYYNKNDLSEKNFYEDFRPKAGDFVINGGAFGGGETESYARAVGKEGKIFAFDPRANVENLIKECLLENVETIPRALWKNSQKMFFENTGSTTTISEKDKVDTNEIETISVDDFVLEEKIKHLDFIKLDVEGAEMEVLKGAERAIRAFNPALAISIYHKLEHFVEIPKYIKYLTSEGYEYHIRYYDPCCIDTYFFAIPIAH
jgi:FkbM family methyltransferase